jgi:3-oxoacyl-[acyl-carrier protein] reductase
MNIIVTGASQGIGYEVSGLFAETGDNTVLAIARNEQKLRNLEKKCADRNKKSKVVAVAYDLKNMISDPSVITGIVLKHFKHIDILVNNAGLLINKPFTDISYKDAREIYDVNLFVPALLIRELLPHMGGSRATHIVNISSMGGFQGSSKYTGLTYYSSSKAALASITECLSSEFSDSNIYFNCLALGSVQTDMFARAFPGYRAQMKPEDIARYIVDFAINGYRYIRGKIIPVSIANP